jgi:transcriptional regulator with PAS, ATPase and Fis domain
MTRDGHGSLEQPVLIGESTAIATLRLEIESAARTQAKVLILGETGVGKEVVARLIHNGGARRSRPFVAVNCSGIPETLLASELFGHVRGSFTGAYRDKIGLVRQADHGTLFLDELGEMSLQMQAALLRFTETGEIQPVGADRPTGRTDVRLITATNRNLRAQIDAGAFREDFYYRLNVIQIVIPPLRERGSDCLLLLDYYLKRASDAHAVPAPTLSRDVEQVLLGYQWPGNIRELRNVAERLALRDFRRPITTTDLPNEVRGTTDAVVQMPVRAREASEPVTHIRRKEAPSPIVEQLWSRLMAGEEFWASVHQAFRAHEITRTDLAMLVDRGLRHTHGSYRALLKVFNMPPTDYKRFHAFLYQHNCNLPVAAYRNPANAIRARERQITLPTAVPKAS